MERTAKLFKNGRSRAVRIPRAFKLEGDDVVLTQHGDGVLIRPAKRDDFSELLAWLRAQPPLEEHERIPVIEDSPPEPVTCFENWIDGTDEVPSATPARS